jgi:hypothetical protein
MENDLMRSPGVTFGDLAIQILATYGEVISEFLVKNGAERTLSVFSEAPLSGPLHFPTLPSHTDPKTTLFSEPHYYSQINQTIESLSLPEEIEDLLWSFPIYREVSETAPSLDHLLEKAPEKLHFFLSHSFKLWKTSILLAQKLSPEELMAIENHWETLIHHLLIKVQASPLRLLF